MTSDPKTNPLRIAFLSTVSHYGWVVPMELPPPAPAAPLHNPLPEGFLVGDSIQCLRATSRKGRQ